MVERKTVDLSPFPAAAYQRWFGAGQDPSLEPELIATLKGIGQRPDEVLASASSDKMKAMLQSQTDAARALEIFGSPTFVVGKEVFWGDDRLDDAIEWQRQGAPARAALLTLEGASTAGVILVFIAMSSHFEDQPWHS